MKEVSLYDVMMLWFKKHDTCTMSQLHDWVMGYREKHNCWVEYHRDEIDYVIYSLGKNDVYWDNKEQILRKQEVIECPCCGTKHYKYPDTDKFYSIINWIDEQLS